MDVDPITGVIVSEASGDIFVDNDPNVSFELSQSSGAEALRNVDVAVTLSAIGGGPVTVGYSVTGGTAAADDYQLAAGTLTFKSGKSGVVLTQTIRLQINNGSRAEPAETLVIELSSPTGAVLGHHSRFTYTILANDLPVPDNGGGNTTDTARVLDLEAPETEGERLRISDGITTLATIGRSREPDTGAFTNHPIPSSCIASPSPPPVRTQRSSTSPDRCSSR